MHVGYFWSRHKDGGHTILPAVSENPMLHTNFSAYLLTTVIADRSFTLQEYGFLHFLLQ